MGRVIYGMITSLDGYTEDAQGDFSWGAPEDEELHASINVLASSVGTYLYGRRMYETMVYWEPQELGLADRDQLREPGVAGGGEGALRRRGEDLGQVAVERLGHRSPSRVVADARMLRVSCAHDPSLRRSVRQSRATVCASAS